MRFLTDTGLQSRIVRGTGGSYVLRMGNTGLRFLTSFALARLLTADQLGVYNFAIAWITLLIVPTLFGLDRLLIREFAKLRANAQWEEMRGLWAWSQKVTIRLALVIMFAASGIAWLLYETTGRPALLKAGHTNLAIPALYTLFIALAVLPLWALMLQQQAVLQGLRHIVTAQFPEQVLRPLIFLILIVVAYLLGMRIDTPQYAMLLLLLATAIAFMLSLILLYKLLPTAMRLANPLYKSRAWVVAALPLGIGRGLSTLNLQVDALMLGTLDSADAVALFTVAFQGTQLIAVLLVSLNATLGPDLARLHSKGNLDTLQSTMVRSARLVTVFTAPLCLLLIIGGRYFLRIFGSEFVDAYPVLVILTFGQFFNVMTGSVGILLIMAGYASSAMIGIAIGTGIHISLNIILIPQWGIAGAAVAAAVSQIFVNLIQMALAIHHLGIHTSVFGSFGSKRE
jgi:O-antigen/teichoic acid export membrane protein